MEYNVYCPSRARPHCVEVMERYFGDRLKLFVHESEIDDYEPYVKVCELIPHQCDNLPDIRNSCLDHLDASGIRRGLMMDDDFVRIRSNAWVRPKWFTGPEAVDVVVQNAFIVLHDLDLPLYTWSGSANPKWHTHHDLFRFNRIALRAWAIYGTEANDGKFPYRVGHKLKTGFDDSDLSLRVFMKDRIIIMDNRWFWDFGEELVNEGGLQGIRSKELKAPHEKVMKDMWGKYAVFNDRDGTRFNFRVNVERKSPLGYK